MTRVTFGTRAPSKTETKRLAAMRTADEYNLSNVQLNVLVFIELHPGLDEADVYAFDEEINTYAVEMGVELLIRLGLVEQYGYGFRRIDTKAARSALLAHAERADWFDPEDAQPSGLTEETFTRIVHGLVRSGHLEEDRHGRVRRTQ